jgi:hypothetical protein
MSYLPGVEVLINDLALAGESALKPRIVIAVDGLDKHGKTRFAFSAPKPLIYLDFDIGKEGVIEKFIKENPFILSSPPFLFRPSEVGFGEEDSEKHSAKIVEAAWPVLQRFRDTYLRALREPCLKVAGQKVMARTVVVDTGTEAWQLLRLAEFGKISQVKPHHYVQVNGLMRDIVRAGFDSNVNVIWLHKLKAEWKDNAEGKGRKTGTIERDGFDGMSYLVQANLLAYRVQANLQQTSSVKWKSGEGVFEVQVEPREADDLGFRLIVGNSRHDPSLEGMTLSNDMINFRTIAQMMLPETTPEDWADAV